MGSNGGRGGEGVTRGLKIGILSLGRRNNTTARMNNERAVAEYIFFLIFTVMHSIYICKKSSTRHLPCRGVGA